MPKLNGLAFLQKVKRDEKLLHIPVIMITSVGTKAEVMAALKSGAKDYIVKPFTKEVLLSKIRLVFDSKVN
jgi:two-component system chemotaxis response regulator CheY